MGALMGGGVGLTIGFIFGSYSILRCDTDSTPITSLTVGVAEAEQGREGLWPRSHNTCLAVLLPFRFSLPLVPYVTFTSVLKKNELIGLSPLSTIRRLFEMREIFLHICKLPRYSSCRLLYDREMKARCSCGRAGRPKKLDDEKMPDLN